MPANRPRPGLFALALISTGVFAPRPRSSLPVRPRVGYGSSSTGTCDGGIPLSIAGSTQVLRYTPTLRPSPSSPVNPRLRSTFPSSMGLLTNTLFVRTDHRCLGKLQASALDAASSTSKHTGKPARHISSTHGRPGEDRGGPLSSTRHARTRAREPPPVAGRGFGYCSTDRYDRICILAGRARSPGLTHRRPPAKVPTPRVPKHGPTRLRRGLRSCPTTKRFRFEPRSSVVPPHRRARAQFTVKGDRADGQGRSSVMIRQQARASRRPDRGSGDFVRRDRPPASTRQSQVQTPTPPTQDRIRS